MEKAVVKPAAGEISELKKLLRATKREIAKVVGVDLAGVLDSK